MSASAIVITIKGRAITKGAFAVMAVTGSTPAVCSQCDTAIDGATASAFTAKDDTIGLVTLCSACYCSPQPPAATAPRPVRDNADDPYSMENMSLSGGATAQSSRLRFNADVVGIIIEYAAATSAVRAHELSRVCKIWRVGFTCSVGLWASLFRARWPNRRRQPRHPTLSLYRSTVLRLLQGYVEPLRRRNGRVSVEPAAVDSGLTAIEDCDFTFRCPIYSEMLRVLPNEKTESGNMVRFCDVCSRKVYSVTSQQELDLRRSQGHCIAFKREDMAAKADPGIGHTSRQSITLLGMPSDNGRSTFELIKAITAWAASNPPGEDGEEFHAEHATPDSVTIVYRKEESNVTIWLDFRVYVLAEGMGSPALPPNGHQTSWELPMIALDETERGLALAYITHAYTSRTTSCVKVAPLEASSVDGMLRTKFGDLDPTSMQQPMMMGDVPCIEEEW